MNLILLRLEKTNKLYKILTVSETNIIKNKKNEKLGKWNEKFASFSTVKRFRAVPKDSPFWSIPYSGRISSVLYNN